MHEESRMKAFLAVLCAGALLMPAPSVWAKTAPAKTTSHKTSPAKRSAPAKPSIFDPPLQTQKRSLPPGKDMSKNVVTCRYYAHFMVKEVDEGEVGATQLSIVPIAAAAGKPPCQRQNLAAEKVVNPSGWTGYFKGVKGDYVFFDADDGVNGGLGFAVVTAADAKKRFDDSAVGNLKSVVLGGTALTLRYARSYSGECSVPHDGAACWSKIAAATGETGAKQPDCAAGYLKAKNDLAKGRCEADRKSGPGCMAAALKQIERQRWDEAPTVIVYDAETVLRPEGASTRPLGAPLACHPSD